jgi:hypothetical protein
MKLWTLSSVCISNYGLSYKSLSQLIKKLIRPDVDRLLIDRRLLVEALSRQVSNATGGELQLRLDREQLPHGPDVSDGREICQRIFRRVKDIFLCNFVLIVSKPLFNKSAVSDGCNE